LVVNTGTHSQLEGHKVVAMA